MNRRKFLRSGSLTGLGLTAVGMSSLRASAGFPQQPSRSLHFPAIDLEEISIAQLQKRMQQGEASSVSITQDYLDRIEKIDRQGPQLNAVIEINPDALSIAETLDR